MKRTELVLCAVLAVTQACNASAQSNKYPQTIAGIFNSADSFTTSGQPSTPLVAVPFKDSIETSVLQELITEGAVPVAVPLEITDFNAMRDAAASLDGIVLTPRFIEMMDKEVLKNGGIKCSPALILAKAAVDRNIPVFGTCDLLKKINAGQRRFDEEYATAADFVAKAKTYKKAKLLMQRIMTIDTHNDQPCRYKDGASIGLRQVNQVSLPKMVEGYLDASIIVSWIEQGNLDKETLAKATSECLATIDKVHKEAEKFRDFCGIATSEQEAVELKQQGKKALFIGVENGQAIGTDLSILKEFRKKDVIYMTLCHTGDNLICHTSSQKSASRDEGLTPFGRDVVAEMNRLGLVIDLSHASQASFRDVVKYSKAPVICSHSGAMSVYRHNRNLTDDQLRALAKNGGVCQVYAVDSFISADGSCASLDDMMKHLKHCVEVAGIDHVGIGTDFDGGAGARGINGDNDMVNITVRLIEEGFSDEDIAKIWGGNFFRVLSEVQSMAKR
jgi:Zn-dependent dipeptidase, microsomal dipeptidase homolog